MKKPVVSLILATYNSSQFLEELLNSLEKQTFKDYELIIIDDCSEDTTREILKKKGYKFFKNKKRMGCTKTLNKAIDSSKGDFIFRLDHDMVYDSNCIKEMVKTITSNKDIGIAGSRSYYYKDKNRIRSFGVDINLITSKATVIGKDKIDKGQFDYVKEINSIGGGNMMIKREVFDQIGLYSEAYFLYYSDLDFCYKAKKNAKYKTVLSKGKAWHKKQERDILNINQLVYLSRDRLTFMKRNSDKYFLFLFIFLFFYIPYNILTKPKSIKVFFKAFFNKQKVF